MGKSYNITLTEAEMQDILSLLLMDNAEENRPLIDKIHAQLIKQGGSYAWEGEGRK